MLPKRRLPGSRSAALQTSHTRLPPENRRNRLLFGVDAERKFTPAKIAPQVDCFLGTVFQPGLLKLGPTLGAATSGCYILKFKLARHDLYMPDGTVALRTRKWLSGRAVASNGAVDIFHGRGNFIPVQLKRCHPFLRLSVRSGLSGAVERVRSRHIRTRSASHTGPFPKYKAPALRVNRRYRLQESSSVQEGTGHDVLREIDYEFYILDTAHNAHAEGRELALESRAGRSYSLHRNRGTGSCKERPCSSRYPPTLILYPK